MISISAAFPSECCDVGLEPIATQSSGDRYPEEITTGESKCDLIGCNTFKHKSFKLFIWSVDGLLDMPLRSAI
jgi:hypothetical protein